MLTERKGRADIGLEWGAGGRCRCSSLQLAEGRHGVIWRTETKDAALLLVRLPCVDSRLKVVCRDARTSLFHYSTLGTYVSARKGIFKLGSVEFGADEDKRL